MPVIHHHICAKIAPFHHGHSKDHFRVLVSRFKLLLSPPFYFSSSSTSSSSLLCRISPFNHNFAFPKSQSSRRQFSIAAASIVESKDEVAPRRSNASTTSYSSFFAGDEVSWMSLGVSDDVSSALSHVSLQRPSLVQAACIPQIYSGKDVIIAAETGSGKTHGYLVPLIDNLYNENIRKANGSLNISDSHKTSLILCPNVILCEQVVKMASTLCNNRGGPLPKVSSVCGRHGWPVEQSDIIVSTPAALLNSLYAHDAGRCRRPEFIRDVKYVVFDEADMLLCGSFQNQIIRLINMFRFQEKELSRMRRTSGFDYSSKMENKLATKDESLSSKLEINNDPVSSDVEDMPVSSNLENEPLILQSITKCGTDSELIDDNDQKLVMYTHDADTFDDSEDCESEESNAGIRKGNYLRRSRKVYRRSKQYIFVAATLPGSGKKTAGGVLKHMFPDAIWVRGHYLHRHNPRLEQRWIEVTVDTQADALTDAVKYSSKLVTGDSSSCLYRTMVFVNTVNAAEAVAKILRQVDIECLCYHSDGSLDERMKTLASFKKNGGILVCTDAAARGLDIPNVSHVIQAEFATSAVDFLHRVGRTARAGQYGIVTSLFTESNRHLVLAVQRAEENDQSVEKAFSRKRSFRNKIKKGHILQYKKKIDDAVILMVKLQLCSPINDTITKVQSKHLHETWKLFTRGLSCKL